MNMMAKIGNSELLQQADVIRGLGSPFVGDILEAAHRQLRNGPKTAELIAHWPGDPAKAAIAMRFNGALHALARVGDLPLLSSLYRREHDDFDGAIGLALSAGDDFIAQWMREPPQTNEVGRAASILAALMVARRETGHPFELLELGSSCGLNLNLAHYSYDLGGVEAGTPDSPVRIAPEWRGTPPLYAPVDVRATRGVDLSPLDPMEAATRERLLCFIWADQRERANRLEQAVNMARRHPPRVDRANAVTWVEEQLRLPQQDGICRVVFHSMVLQYLSEKDRLSVENSIRRAGEGASADRPLAWIAFEWTPDRREVRLSLTCWPDGRKRHLATCHPYGEWVHWHG